MMFMMRSRDRDAIRRDITAHGALMSQAAAEFSCKLPEFHPEYLQVMCVLRVQLRLSLLAWRCTMFVDGGVCETRH